MIFNAVDKYTFLSECGNYKISFAVAGKQPLFTCFRLTESNTWENINEFLSYLTFQSATFRINEVHRNEPEKALLPIPGANKSTKDYALNALKNIKHTIGELIE